MKHSGKARRAAFRIILATFIIVAVLVALGAIAAFFGTAVVVIAPFLIGIWVVFALFTLYFFRDPTARVPKEERAILSPAHGKVDVVDITNEAQFMGGQCQRISMFLSVVNVHVQNAPLAGKVVFYKSTSGQFLNALKTECIEANENLLLGFEPSITGLPRVAVRLIAGAIARRIVPFVQQGDVVAAGERIGLIQFGSRVDLYLPTGTEIKVKIGDKVVGGETVVAVLP
jgi:phosphatidylserine decarboxylase